MSASIGLKIVRNGLTLLLDAADPLSYVNGASIWYDMSGNNYHFNVPTNIWISNGPKSYMNFDHTLDRGIAKRIINSSLADVPSFTNATICVVSTLFGYNADWHTLCRSASGDHPAIIYYIDGISLGMFDGSAGWLDSGYDVSSITNYTTEFNFYVWKFAASNPYYQFFYNDNLATATATITSASATYDQGFCCIGGYHDGVATVTSASQYWGKMSIFLYYNRHLSETELRQNYNALKGRFLK
jgi:hypothetical protein